MKKLILLFLGLLISSTSVAAQGGSKSRATDPVQQSQSGDADTSATKAKDYSQTTESTGRIIPAGTPIDVEVAYTVNSLDMKPGERISFRVLVPIVIDGVTLIEKDALVTARITQAKRGGHWGKAGKLAWSMEDVIAADGSRVPLALETATRSFKLWSLEPKAKASDRETKMGEGRVTGTSHAGEVAAVSIAGGILFPPLALMGGFKRGENAILREGRRFVVSVGRDTSVRVTAPVVSR